MRKKLLSILLVLSLMLALVPAAFAADAVRTELESDGTTLAFYGSGVATADCWNGDWTAVTHVDLGYEIRGVAENVLARCVNLVSFEAIGSRYLRTYNGGLISIDGRQMLAAPNRCTAYEILNLVQTVKTGAFRYCQGLTAVTFPASLTTIEAQAFTSCLSLTDVQLPDGLKTIGDFAFAGCAALTSVLIPKSVTSIGAGAFTGCTALTAIDYSGTEAEWAQLTKGENALPEGVTVNFNAPIHHYGSWTGTDPNCTTEGKRTRTCTDDGCGHTEEMTLPARGHYWGIGRVTTLPTETTTGVRTYTCRTYGCNATRTEEIPKLAPRVPVSERFDDVAPNSWAYEDIQYCVDYELMAGVGGGVLFVPLVSGFFPFHLDFVRGAGLMVALAGALAAGPGLLRRNLASLRLALPVALIASACSILGAVIGLALPTTIVQTCLGCTILGIACLLLFSKNSVRPIVTKQDAIGLALGMHGSFLEPTTGEVVDWKTHHTLVALLLFIVIGIMAGMFGLGAGWANVPVLNLLMGVPLKVGVGTSKFLLSITDTAAAWVYLNQGCVIPLMAIPSIVGLMLGSIVGVRLLAVAKPKVIRYMVIIVLFFSGIKALMKGLGW
mgnify:CR=1 FL=1